MTPNQQLEELSKAYLHAVAARCGFAVANWSQDHGCVDTTVSAVLASGRLKKAKVDIQLKATQRNDVEYDDHVSWSLDAEHYSRLCEAAHVPHLLVVLLLEKELSDCVEHTVEQLVIRRCAYWVKMTGMPATNNETRQTVKIPKSQVFSPEQLSKILTEISEGRFA